MSTKFIQLYFGRLYPADQELFRRPRIERDLLLLASRFSNPIASSRKILLFVSARNESETSRLLG